ncbi:ABC1 kinase family protein [Amnimonas aquatica]|uniref:2-octaprenylphenol hydroxylase n=1 Tax=Amnimonas aquatica TaxID=2094561 RepID=A0A2P6ATR6_9GAMM|nr:AarF/UbiB family protein [Amnimonas aquatica]PQA48270.1 2-octaprenylphenol hydroxylase [Amnimonas aquatica]
MIRHWPRLLQLWTVFARYRLDTLLPPPPGAAARLALLAIRLHPAWWLAGDNATRPDRVRRAFEELGPLFIKLGQLLSTRRDLLDPAVLDELEHLQENVAPFPVAEAKAIVERELGVPLAQHFARFDDQPLAAASIAQVHTAALLDGREVVVKVLRPGVAERIRTDMALLKDVARLAEERLQMRVLPLQRIVSDYERTLLDETDLAREADNTRQLRINFANSPLFYVPEVHDANDSREVMIAERIEGVPINDHATFARLGIDREKLANKGLTIFFTQVFRDNFFHADMHPGNVYVETGNPADPRFIGLDCAIVGSLPTDDQLTIAQILLSLIQRDFTQLVRIAAQAGWIPAGAPLDLIAREVRRLVEPVLTKPIDQVNLAPILAGLLDLARTHELQIPPQFVLLLKTLIHVEGLGRELYPQLDIWSLAKPLLKQWLNDRIGPKALLRRITEDTPLLIAGLPDLPQLVFDALTQMRQNGQWQSRQLAELKQMQRQLAASRRHDFLAWTGLLAGAGLLLAAPLGLAAVAASPAAVPAGIALVAVSLVWRLLAK